MAESEKGVPEANENMEDPSEDMPDEEMFDLDFDLADVQEETDGAPMWKEPIPGIGADSQGALTGNVLTHLGAFLWNFGILMQQGQAAPPRGVTYALAKAALVRKITEKINEIMHDSSLSFAQKNAARTKLNEAIRRIRVCSAYGHAVGHGFINNVRRDPDLSDHRTDLDFLRLWSYLIMVKNTWKWGNPQFRFDRQRRKVQLWRNGRVIMEFPVSHGSVDRAQSVVDELNNTLNACNYPDQNLAEKLAILGQ